jgi:hypothetical protein
MASRAASPLIAPHLRVPMQDPRIMIGQLQQENARLRQDNERVAVENDGMKMRTQHLTMVLIGIIRQYSEGKELRISKVVQDKLETEIATLGTNTRTDPANDDLVVEIMTQKEFAIQMAGMQQGYFEATVPKKPPYRIQVKLPEGATFFGPEVVCYRGGRSNGKELVLVKGKPKKVREYSVDADAVFSFTTDSAGMDVGINFLIRMPVVPEESTETVAAPLEYKNDRCRDWHTHENDGEKYIGRSCPECGDTRKAV